MSDSAPRDSIASPSNGPNVAHTADPSLNSRKRPHDASAQAKSAPCHSSHAPSPDPSSGDDARHSHHNNAGIDSGAVIRHKVEERFNTHAERYNRAGKEVSQLIEYVDGKVASWEQEQLPGAPSLGRAIRNLVSQFADGKDPLDSPPTTPTVLSTTPVIPNGTGNSKRTKTFAAVAKSATEQTGPVKPRNNMRRIFVRLSEDHPARSASPYAIRQLLREKLGENVAGLIDEVSRVKTGLAIVPQTPMGERILMDNTGGIQKALEGCNVDVEDKWAIFVIPSVPRSYPAFNKETVVITEEAALEEFKIQVPGVQPIKFYWSKKSAEQATGTIVVAVSEAQASRMPFKVQLFNSKTFIKRKHLKPTLERCTRCWDMHNPRNCTRAPRCRLCASTKHLAAEHPVEDSVERCCNCDGPHPADHVGCPALPTIERGQVARHTRTNCRQFEKLVQRSASAPLQGEH